MKALVTLVTLLCCAASARAQVVVEGEQGPLEVIGLRQWTLRDVEDSIARYAPGESLRSHACAVVLRDRLHFASAAVTYYTDANLKPSHVVVVVVEPQDSARARRRVVSGSALPPQWPDIRQVAADSTYGLRDLPGALQLMHIVRQVGGDSAVKVMAPHLGADRMRRTAELARVLALHAAPADRELAMKLLRADTSGDNRVLAAAVLSNFPAQDETWHALVAALRDPREDVANTARAALGMLRLTAVRPVDWRPALDDLVPLLAGANAWGYADLLALLADTGVERDLASALLADNWHLVLAHARARHPSYAKPARDLLVALGADAAAGPDAWEAWLRSLEPGR